MQNPSEYHPDQSFARELSKNRLHYTAGGNVLVIAFDNAGDPHSKPKDRLPWGHKFFVEEGCSVLGVIAHESDWYRSPDLFDALSTLASSGFCGGFDRIMLTGSSMGGFAAAAFASVFPGCSVVSYNPQSTLHNDLVPWETLHRNGRMQNWDGPCADGARGIQAAAVAFVFFDPYHELDRRHAERLAGPNVHFLKAPFLGHGLPTVYSEMGMLKEIMRAGMRGEIDEGWYYRTIRARKSLEKYYKEIAVSLARHKRFEAGRRIMNRAFKNYGLAYFVQREALFASAQGDIEQGLEILAQEDRRRRKRRRKSK